MKNDLHEGIMDYVMAHINVDVGIYEFYGMHYITNLLEIKHYDFMKDLFNNTAELGAMVQMQFCLDGVELAKVHVGAEAGDFAEESLILKYADPNLLQGMIDFCNKILTK